MSERACAICRQCRHFQCYRTYYHNNSQSVDVSVRSRVWGVVDALIWVRVSMRVSESECEEYEGE